MRVPAGLWIGKAAGGLKPGRSKKIRFTGNRYTRQEQGQESETQDSTSRRKLRTSEEFKPTVMTGFVYVILEFFQVFGALSDYLKCKQCGGDIKFETSNIRGLGLNIEVRCRGKNCKVKTISSCPIVNKSFEINVRIQFAFRLLGVAYSGLKLFCGIMDMRPPIQESYFSTVNRKIKESCEAVAEYVMNKAAKEERKVTAAAQTFENPKWITVSVDGLWMKRGFTSLFGIVVLIGEKTGKVNDIIVKSSYCKVCEMWEKKDHESQEYQDYLDEHWGPTTTAAVAAWRRRGPFSCSNARRRGGAWSTKNSSGTVTRRLTSPWWRLIPTALTAPSSRRSASGTSGNAWGRVSGSWRRRRNLEEREV